LIAKAESQNRRVLNLGKAMKRRDFVTLPGGAVAWPLAARAQQRERRRRIGVLMNLAVDDPESHLRIAAFSQGLGELGWVIGRNVDVDYRWAAGEPAFSGTVQGMLRPHGENASYFND
jgi:hypothetical protein